MPTPKRTAIALLLAGAALLTLATVGLAAPASPGQPSEVSPEPSEAFLDRVDPHDRPADPSPPAPSSGLASWDLEGSSSFEALLAQAPVDEPAATGQGCAPHPPISITEEVGQQGFILGHDEVTGEPIYRPGSGVVAGSGTAEDPYVIEGWCIEATGNTQGFPACIIVPGVEQWCGNVPNDLVRAPDAAISIEGTDAHVVVRDNVVSGSSLAVNPVAPNANGIVLDEAANATVADNVAALTTGGIISLDSDRVEIRSNTVVYALSSGLTASGGHPVTVAGNEVVLANRGLWILDADEATLVEDNRVTNASFEGIRVQDGDKATLRGNTVDEAGGNLALHVDESTDLRVSGNELVGGGLALTGERLDHYVHEVDDTNRVNGEPLVYLHQDHGARVEEPVGQLVLVDTNGVKAEGLSIQQAAYGIHAIEGAGLTVEDVLVEGTRNGIVLDGTTAARVTDTAVHGAAPAPGILVDGADSTRLTANTVTASGVDAGVFASAGIVVTDGEETTLRDNEATSNDGFGVGIWGTSRDTVVEDGQTHRNALHGLVVGDARSTEIHDLDARSNGGFGIDVRGTATNVTAAELRANAGGGLRGFEAHELNVTDTRIHREADRGPVAELQDEPANGVALWDAREALVEASTVTGYANATALYQANENVTVQGNELTGNGYGVWVEAGLIGQPSDLRVEQNAIEANSEGGLYAGNLAEPLDARDNWWGHASGPSGATADACADALADGDGQAIVTQQASVCFTPWLEQTPS